MVFQQLPLPLDLDTKVLKPPAFFSANQTRVGCYPRLGLNPMTFFSWLEWHQCIAPALISRSLDGYKSMNPKWPIAPRAARGMPGVPAI